MSPHPKFIFIVCPPGNKNFKRSMSRSCFSRCLLCPRPEPALPVSAGTGGRDFSPSLSPGGRQRLQAHLPRRKGGRLCLPVPWWGKILRLEAFLSARAFEQSGGTALSAGSSQEPRVRDPRNPQTLLLQGPLSPGSGCRA